MATDTTTTINEPWSGIQPYLKNLYGYAQRNYAKPLQYYSGSTVAGLSDQTQGALQGIANLGMGGPQFQQPANNLLTNTLQGNFLNSNPYLDQMYGQAAGQMTRAFNEGVLPNISARFGMSGRSGSGLFANAVDSASNSLQQNLGGLASNIYGQNYANERQNQMGALGMVPGMTQNSFYGLNQALGAGQLYDAQNQAQLTDKVNRFNFTQMEPWQRLNLYQSAITGGNAGGGSSTTTGPRQSMLPTYAGIGLGLGGLLFG